jgi:hypothetical protein
VSVNKRDMRIWQIKLFFVAKRSTLYAEQTSYFIVLIFGELNPSNTRIYNKFITLLRSQILHSRVWLFYFPRLNDMLGQSMPFQRWNIYVPWLTGTAERCTFSMWLEVWGMPAANERCGLFSLSMTTWKCIPASQSRSSRECIKDVLFRIWPAMLWRNKIHARAAALGRIFAYDRGVGFGRSWQVFCFYASLRACLRPQSR